MDYLKNQETEHISAEDIASEAIRSVEENGIVFLDEIDKVCRKKDSHSIDSSSEGVQRDLLPIIEGTTVNTTHGDVDTSKILFIASGAFYAVRFFKILLLYSLLLLYFIDKTKRFIT